MCPKQQEQIYENYPVGTVLLANALAISIYLLGAVIMSQVNVWAMLLYLVFCLILEFKLLATGCVHCHYYGKVCFSGKGMASAWFFKKGNPKVFAKREITWKQLLPDMLVALLPAVVGVYLLIRNFQWYLVFLVIGFLLLAMPGNGFIRSTQACCHCRQRKLGCPAEKLFQKKNVKT